MPTTLKELLDNLDPVDKAVLDYAFELGVSQVIKLPEGFYIGVNCRQTKNCEPLMEAGEWSYGHWNEANSFRPPPSSR